MKGIPFPNQGAVFLLTLTPFVSMLSFVCFDLMYRSLAQSQCFCLGEHVYPYKKTQLRHSFAPASFLLSSPLIFLPSTKRERADGTGNLAASYCCPLGVFCQTLTGNKPVIRRRATAGVVV